MFDYKIVYYTSSSSKDVFHTKSSSHVNETNFNSSPNHPGVTVVIDQSVVEIKHHQNLHFAVVP